jgi:predicted molibdopterin-dependent oxidoreductase YjgC
MRLEMKYFVLKPRAKSVDDTFAEASQNALFAYADIIEKNDPEFADEIRSWAHKEVFKMAQMKYQDKENKK